MQNVANLVTNVSDVCVCVLGILQKMKEGAENVERKIQAKVESLKNANENEKGKRVWYSQKIHVILSQSVE